MSLIISIWTERDVSHLPNHPLRLWSLFVLLSLVRYFTLGELLIIISDVYQQYLTTTRFCNGWFHSILHGQLAPFIIMFGRVFTTSPITFLLISTSVLTMIILSLPRHSPLTCFICKGTADEHCPSIATAT